MSITDELVDFCRFVGIGSFNVRHILNDSIHVFHGRIVPLPYVPDSIIIGSEGIIPTVRATVSVTIIQGSIQLISLNILRIHIQTVYSTSKVLENGMPRFFKRLAEGVFDLEDLKFRTRELADFVKDASNIYGFDLNKTIAVGFSNGANIAASLLLSYPGTLMGAILFRAMVPFIPNSPPDLSDKKVLLSAGVYDPIVSESQTQSLYDILKKSRANVTLKWQQSGHNLTESDILDAKEWLSESIR